MPIWRVSTSQSTEAQQKLLVRIFPITALIVSHYSSRSTAPARVSFRFVVFCQATSLRHSISTRSFYGLYVMQWKMPQSPVWRVYLQVSAPPLFLYSRGWVFRLIQTASNKKEVEEEEEKKESSGHDQRLGLTTAAGSPFRVPEPTIHDWKLT